MNSAFKVAEKHTYEVMCEEDPRWAQIFEEAPQILTRYHGPLPPGDVSDLCVMFIVQVSRLGGYEETVYFANKDEIARWQVPVVDKKMSEYDCTGTPFHEKLAVEHPDWTVSQMLDYVERLP